jgi:hypothetical protein
VRLRRSLNQNSTVSPWLSIARYKYIQRPRTLTYVSSTCHSRLTARLRRLNCSSKSGA